MPQQRNLIIGIVVAVLLGALVLKDYIVVLVNMLFFVALALLPIILLILLIGIGGYFGYSYVRDKEKRSRTAQRPAHVNLGNRTKELSEALAVAFRRNNMRQLQQSLAQLPPWPITQHVQQTAQELAELKRSIYRAQAEGVPASMIARYLQQLNQAAETVWHLASKVDAVGLQNVSYHVVAPRLQLEELKLQQLQHAITAAHEGIALLILVGIKSDILRDVEDNLTALTQAVKSLDMIPGAAETGLVPASHH